MNYSNAMRTTERSHDPPPVEPRLTAMEFIPILSDAGPDLSRESPMDGVRRLGRRPAGLKALGMTKSQVEEVTLATTHHQGLILVAGPSDVDKAATVDALTFSIGSQDRAEASLVVPMEISDRATAAGAIEAAASGHLAVCAIESSNALTALYRLERLRVSRRAIGNTLIAVVGQRRVRTLCPDCRVNRRVPRGEARLLSRHTYRTPSRIAGPGRCESCEQTGYVGWDGVFEVVTLDSELHSLLERGQSVGRMRSFLRSRGDLLLAGHVMEKLGRHVTSLSEAYERVLVEEPAADPLFEVARATSGRSWTGPGPKSVLLISADPAAGASFERQLSNAGYRVEVRVDAASAIAGMSRGSFDLIVADIDMPGLDGSKLLELVQMFKRQTTRTRVVFLTPPSGLDAAQRDRCLGDRDWLARPVDPDRLLLHVVMALNGVRQPCRALDWGPGVVIS